LTQAYDLTTIYRELYRGKKLKSSVLYLGKDKVLLKKIDKTLSADYYEFYSCANFTEAEQLIDKQNITIILVSGDNDIYLKIRNRFLNNPIQIIYISDKDEDISDLLNTGYDDFIKNPFDEKELRFRLKAALIRYQQQNNIIEERNFFRDAVKSEEALSAKILDQHLHLKQAFLNIEHLNEELSQSNQRLEKIARYDLLSGLLNRMSLFSMIDLEIERCVRSSSVLSAMMLDIDDFKQVNDNYGHLPGDKVIKVFGELLTNSLRKYDHPGRYGGEEFFVVLPTADYTQAFQIAERFRENLAATDIDLVEGKSIRVTTSIGIAQYRKGETRENWIARSDKALYEAKRKGKNKTCIYSDSE
jgi:diguanylate cyclase (GGDEF)-like protein